ncbi:hypothetical protein Adt_02360 [Abeliophyllum distichum]|uniref:Uncharacterized protein n=1 Tax=Abeliophyllum distichum TaxID=126358 RepID=A0ABD1VVN5_9LAMI
MANLKCLHSILPPITTSFYHIRPTIQRLSITAFLATDPAARLEPIAKAYELAYEVFRVLSSTSHLAYRCYRILSVALGHSNALSVIACLFRVPKEGPESQRCTISFRTQTSILALF